MLLPISSTSELRYWPFATAAMILFNVAAFVVQLQLPDWEPYLLSHGDGLHPLQWLTSNFMHADVVHLIGNMIFLWVFGHIVEGVVGHWMFAALFLGLGVLGNVIGQLAFLGSDAQPSLGASGAIYSIMLLAAWFAPHDQIQAIFIFFYRVFFFEIPVLMMAGIYFLLDMATTIAIDFELSTPLLHAIGGVVGLVAGFALLKTGLVENDGQDALTQLRAIRGGEPEQASIRPKSRQELEQAKQQQDALERALATARKSLDMHWQASNLDGVLHQIRQLRRLDNQFVVDEDLQWGLIRLAQKKQRWAEVAQFSDEYLKSFSQRAVTVRLNLARVLLERQGLPIRALKCLKALHGVALDEKQRSIAVALQRHCLKEIDEGTLEPES